ncbi:MAG: polysaccharide pyruvyl transferase family protein, partial [Acidobacteriota bacterium]
PFEKPLLNLLRRRFFKLFDALCVREDKSASMLGDLLGREIEVTADSALQRSIPAMDRDRFFTGDRRPLADKFLVSLTAIRHNFQGVVDAADRQARYEEVLLEAIAHLQTRRDCHFLLLPQLYGAAKSDVPYHRELAARFPAGTSWQLVDPDLHSDAQRSIVGMCDLSIACRYHPQIFASSGATPGICIYYEHKAFSHVQALGLDAQAFDIFDIGETRHVLAALDRAVDDGEALSAQIRERLPALVERARRTTDLACSLVAAGPRA